MSLPKPYYEEPGIVIYHSDCREILPHLPDSCADLVLTSPPYNVNNDEHDLGHGRNWKDSKWTGRLLTHGYSETNGDAMPWGTYERHYRHILACTLHCLSDAAAIYCVHKPRLIGTETWLPISLNPGLELRQIVTWQRAGGVNFSGTHYLPTCEWVLIFATPTFRLRDQSASGVGDVWRIAQENNTEHPSPFPLKLAIRAIETTPAERILDPMCGSGTTLVAAKQLGRKAIGIEIEEKYCAIAVDRLRQEVLPFEPSREKKELAQLSLMQQSGHPDQDGLKRGIEDWIVEDAMKESEGLK